MAEVPGTFLDALEQGARNAEREEAEFRASYRDRLDTLERERALANRRLSFMRKLAAVVGEAEDQEGALAAGDRLLTDEFGLSKTNPAHQPVFAEFRKVSDEADTVLNCEDAPDHAAVITALANFENWYHAHTGIAFYALYDVYVQQTPVVDF